MSKYINRCFGQLCVRQTFDTFVKSNHTLYIQTGKPIEASYIYNGKSFTKSVFVQKPKYKKCEAHGFIYNGASMDPARYNM
jgi:hypothetical protein